MKKNGCRVDVKVSFFCAYRNREHSTCKYFEPDKYTADECKFYSIYCQCEPAIQEQYGQLNKELYWAYRAPVLKWNERPSTEPIEVLE